MVKIALDARRSMIEQTVDSLRITIPAEKSSFSIRLLLCWLLAWACSEFGMLFYLPELLAAPVTNGSQESVHKFIYIWLAFWTLGGAFSIYAWLWEKTGKDIVVITPSQLQHIKSVLGIERSKQYDLLDIKNMRTLAPVLSKRARYNTANWGLLTIAFDEGSHVCKFGEKLDEAEANCIVDTIKQQFKSL
ncbi:MAG: hypothetical protein ABL933_03200 [Methyloglobulus sp.]|nr:hypothetical protein [Methyloglobulus sp.]